MVGWLTRSRDELVLSFDACDHSTTAMCGTAGVSSAGHGVQSRTFGACIQLVLLFASYRMRTELYAWPVCNDGQLEPSEDAETVRLRTRIKDGSGFLYMLSHISSYLISLSHYATG